MNTKQRRGPHGLLLWAVVSLGLMFCADAEAYIDPNAPSALYQLLFPLIVAITVARTWLVAAFKKLWSKLIRRDG